MYNHFIYCSQHFFSFAVLEDLLEKWSYAVKNDVFRWPIETLNEPMPHLSCTQSPRQFSVSYHYVYFDPQKRKNNCSPHSAYNYLVQNRRRTSWVAMFDLAGFTDLHLKQLRTKLPLLCSWCHNIFWSCSQELAMRSIINFTRIGLNGVV